MRKIPCLVYSRVVGYFSPTLNWNAGKKEEFRQRRPYSVAKSMVSKAIADGDILELESLAGSNTPLVLSVAMA